MKRFKNNLIKIIFIAATIYILPNLFSPLLKREITAKLQSYLGTNINIGSLYINPYTRTITLKKITVSNSPAFKTGDFFLAKTLKIKPGILSFLIGKPIIKKTVLDAPHFYLYQSSNKKTNWDFLWTEGPWNKNKIKPGQKPVILKEVLIKDGSFTYIKEFENANTATAESTGIFIYLLRHSEPIGFIEGTPLPSTIKGRANIPDHNYGKIKFNGKINLEETKTNFIINLNLNKIPLTYFNDFQNSDSAINITEGTFNAISLITCSNNELQSIPEVTIEDLHFKIKPGSGGQKIFGLPTTLVIQFFDIYKEKLQFSFEIKGTISKPEFIFGDAISSKISAVIGESIVKSIFTKPNLILKFGKKIGNLGLGAIKKMRKPTEKDNEDGSTSDSNITDQTKTN